MPIATDDIREHNTSDRVRYAFLYDTSRWKLFTRPRALALHPFCVCCPEVTEIIDHRVPAGVAIQQVQDSGRYPLDRWLGFYLLSNLQGLCRRCHGTKTLADKLHVGPWDSVLDVEDRQPKRRYVF